MWTQSWQVRMTSRLDLRTALLCKKDTMVNVDATANALLPQAATECAIGLQHAG